MNTYIFASLAVMVGGVTIALSIISDSLGAGISGGTVLGAGLGVLFYQIGIDS